MEVHLGQLIIIQFIQSWHTEPTCAYHSRVCRTHNLLVLLGRTLGHEQSAVARSAAQHCRWRWLVASLFVVSYSWVISMFLPYFSSLVGIVASSTYLVGGVDGMGSPGMSFGNTVVTSLYPCSMVVQVTHQMWQLYR